jgi:alpha-L-rhamnosidase
MLVRLAVCALALATNLRPSALTTYELECEARSSPVGIDTATPRLSWKLKSAVQGAAQRAYQILVARSPELLTESSADLWNSGKVTSTESTWIAYRGKPLSSFQRCWWKIRVWSTNDTSPAWSEPAQWTTSLLNPADRKGAWISTASNQLRAGPMPLYRKSFAMYKTVRQAILLVAGLGFAEVHVNGSLITQDVLAPGWTNFKTTVLYDAYDVTSLLHSGENAIGVMLGNGFYNVVGGRYAKYTGSFGAPRLWLDLHVSFSDGTSSDISTDTTWRTHPGPITFSDMYGGEDYDSRQEIPDWDTPQFVDASWEQAANTEAPGGELRWHSAPPIRVFEHRLPVRITEPKPSVYVYDLGQNAAGWPKIVVSGEVGATIKLIPGELLDANGFVSQHASGAPVSFSYVLKGTVPETWSPRFSYYGFRYVQVEGAVPENAPPGMTAVVLMPATSVSRAISAGHYSFTAELPN